MKKILCVVDAPGPAEFIAPVIPLFRGIELRLVAVKGAPTEILKKFHPLRCDTEAEAEAIYQKHKPDALLVAMSSLMLGPYVNKRFTELFHESGKPIIAFQDYWANHRQPQNAIVQSYWDALLVPDALAERYVEEDGFHGNVYVTGNPAFEKFKNVKVADERKRLRKKFGISEAAKVIFYAGTGTPQSAGADNRTFAIFADAIRALDKAYEIVCIAHPHPRDEYPKRYREAAPDLPFVEIREGISDSFLPIADVVISMYSTSLIHACYLRIPAVSIVFPGAGKRRLQIVGLDDFPPNTFGASVGVYEESWEALGHALQDIFEKPSVRGKLRKNQEKYFQFPEKSSAEAVRETIYEYLNV